MNPETWARAYDLSPVQCINGRWYKREDLYRHPSGVNGGKWRQCQWLVGRMRGDFIVTGASVLSPQHAMTAVAAEETGRRSWHVIGATTREKALRHPSIRTAAEHGAHFDVISVAYNPNLQNRVNNVAAQLAGEILHYGVTPGPETTPEGLDAFHELGARQTENLPRGLRALIVPFGSGNSAASVLLGLWRYMPPAQQPREVHLIGIGPDRQNWLGRRMAALGIRSLQGSRLIFHQTGIPYGQRMPYLLDGIELHPTYEGKVAHWLDAHPVAGWEERDNDVCLWIVGAALS